MVRSFKKGEVLAAKLGTMACPTEMSPQTVKWLFTENSGRYPQNHPDPLEALGAEANRCIGNTRRNTRCWTLRINTDHVQPAHDFFWNKHYMHVCFSVGIFCSGAIPTNMWKSMCFSNFADGFWWIWGRFLWYHNYIYIWCSVGQPPPPLGWVFSLASYGSPPCGGGAFGMLVMGGQSCFLWFPASPLWPVVVGCLGCWWRCVCVCMCVCNVCNVCMSVCVCMYVCMRVFFM